MLASDQCMSLPMGTLRTAKVARNPKRQKTASHEAITTMMAVRFACLSFIEHLRGNKSERDRSPTVHHTTGEEPIIPSSTEFPDDFEFCGKHKADYPEFPPHSQR